MNENSKQEEVGEAQNKRENSLLTMINERRKIRKATRGKEAKTTMLMQ